MGKRHFVAVYTECNCILACSHKHPNVATATACISHPGGYVVAVRRRKLVPLTPTEEAEFQTAMYGRSKPVGGGEGLNPGLLAPQNLGKA
jgi:hypothetical protein